MARSDFFMLIEETVSKMQELKLYAMARAFIEKKDRPDHQDLSREDFVSLLIDAQLLQRQQLRQTRMLTFAKLKISSASLEDIDYRHPRGLVKSKVIQLQNLEWLEKHHNLLISGPTGVGKTYLACAFGQWACRHGYSTVYFRCSRLFGDLLAAKGEGTYLNHLKRLGKVKLLIIDDFGLNAMTDTDRKDFMEVIEERYMTGSTIIAGQLPLSDWHEFIGAPALADAMLDRLFHQAYKFELKGASMRKTAEKTAP
jgi:DNA replication protein DnaC